MVSASSPTANWETIENVFYRKEELYTMLWQIPDLSDYIVAGAKFGGPIALLRDERKIMMLGQHSIGKPKIMVYTSAGDLICSLSWDLPPPILLTWTSQERLLSLSEDGTYRLYSLSGEYSQYTLGAEINELGVISARVHEAGMVVLHGGLGFVQVKGWEGGRALPLVDAGLTEPPHCWTVIPPELSMSRHVEVLVATGDTVITVDELERIDQHLSRGPFTHLRPSPNGKFLALITASNILWVVSSDFSRNLSEVSIAAIPGNEEGEAPVEVEWCGDNGVVLGWREGKVGVVGPRGEGLIYNYPPAVLLVGEIDGLRIISSEACEFIQKVPDSTLALFQPGSTRPAAILYDALDQFDRKSPKADENIRSIRPELAEAVDTCIEAAGGERDGYWQKRLLKAAMFGRAFLDLYNPTDLVDMAQTLKVLNAVRYYEIGIPMTLVQYNASSPEKLISRLVARNLHLLALRISNHLDLRPDPVLKHWACAKIAAARTDPGDAGAIQDDELRKEIVRKFEKEGGKGASYADIARKAWQLGRTRLATKLLDHEPRAAEQVPLLLAMKEDRLALIKAIDSGDTDLVYHVLLHLKTKMAPGDFFSLVDDGSEQLAPAVKLLQVYAREGERPLLRDFYYQDDRRAESACLELEEGGASNDIEDRLQSLKNAIKYFSEDKERPFETKMMEDAHRLLAAQQTIEKDHDYKYTFVGLSVSDTLTHLITCGLGKRADKLRSDFKVPDKRFWWIKLKALATIRDWEGLEAFARSKKSPIGYEPFVTHLLSIKQPSHAVVFVPRCDVKTRVDFYIKCDDWAKAAAECKDRGDKARLEELRRTAPTTLAQREVEDVIRRMTK